MVPPITSDIIIFLDDDAEVLTPDLWERTDKFFTQHPRCAVISFRIVDEDGISARRHNPRFGHFLDKPGTVGTFLGGACAIRRAAFEACGGYDDSSSTQWRNRTLLGGCSIVATLFITLQKS